MRAKANPQPAALPRHQGNEDGCFDPKARGLDVLNSPQSNQVTAFTGAERKALGLAGLIPPEINKLARQVKGAYVQFERLPDALSRNIYLITVRQRGTSLLSQNDDFRSVSLTVAVAVAEGLARVQFTEFDRKIQEPMGQPEYRQTAAA